MPIYVWTYMFMHMYAYKDQLGLKQTEVDTLEEKKREEPPLYKLITTWKPFKLQKWVSWSLIE